jgi:hypothetical protein
MKHEATRANYGQDSNFLFKMLFSNMNKKENTFEVTLKIRKGFEFQTHWETKRNLTDVWEFIVA